MKLPPAAITAVFLLTGGALLPSPAATQDQSSDATGRARVSATLSTLPLRFEENRGQADPQVKYLARGPGYTLFLTGEEAVLAVRESVVRVRLENADRTASLRGESALDVPTNYFIGADPKQWRAALNYERVRCAEVYPGIDVVYHGKQHALEYDFEVAAGVDPAQIALRYEGANALRIDKDGALILTLPDGGELRQPKPVSYQIIDGARRAVESRYGVRGKDRVVFELGDYDGSHALVIDPLVLGYSTYLGGNGASDAVGIAVDGAGNAYITGSTFATNFPLAGEFQSNQPNLDVFVTKLNTNATGAAALLYSTYLGGADSDTAGALAIDSAGNIVVTGDTSSTNFPLVSPYQSDQPDTDAYVAKIDPNATGAASLVYSTYLGGDGLDTARAVTIGSGGNVFLTGFTTSDDFPTLNPYQAGLASAVNNDAFVTKLDPSVGGAASLLYSTYLGGDGPDTGTAIAVRPGGVVLIAGRTDSTDFPIFHQYQSHQGLTDAFVTRLDPALSGAAQLLYSTYLGGSSRDEATGMVLVPGGNIYVAGLTESLNFPTLNPFQTNQGDMDGFVARLDPTETGAPSLIYSTYLGGSDVDQVTALALDPAGEVVVAGHTESVNFPTLDPLQTNQPDRDAFVAKLDTSVSGPGGLLFGTYLGGNAIDRATGVAVDPVGRIYVTGMTASTNFPLLNQFQTDQPSSDAFITKYVLPPPANDTCAAPTPVSLDSPVMGTTAGATNDYQLSGVPCFGGIGQIPSVAAGGDLVYHFTAPAAGSYSFRLRNYTGSGNPVVYLASSCPAASPGMTVNVTTCLAGANRTDASASPFTAEEIPCVALSASQTVFIFVDEDSLSTGGSFTLEVNVCASESEGNNTPGLADTLAYPITGSINPNTDADLFALGALPTGSRIFALLDARAANSDDLELRVTTNTDTLEYDNSDAASPFGEASATIAGRATVGGGTFLRVTAFNAGPAVATEPYRLYTVVQPSSTTATAESEPNDTLAQADFGLNNYFSGSLAGPAPSTDLDLFAFIANAGDLIFLSLDGDPSRNSTPLNASLSLLDASGAVLLEVNDSSSTSSTASGAGSLTSTTPFSPAESLVFRAPVSGNYYAAVAIGTNSGGATGTGDYLLSVTRGLRLTAAVSRKQHGANAFDIPLGLGNQPSVECRSSGNHTLVFIFTNPIVSGDAFLTSGTGSVSAAPTFSSNTMTVSLTGVTDVQKITVTLSGVTDSVAQVLPDTPVSMNILAGDVNGNKTVNASDIGQTKSQSGAAVTLTNFRQDVAVNGTINATDIGLVKSRSGQSLP